MVLNLSCTIAWGTFRTRDAWAPLPEGQTQGSSMGPIYLYFKVSQGFCATEVKDYGKVAENNRGLSGKMVYAKT